MPSAPEGWRSVDRRSDDGAIESEQRAAAARRIVDASEDGARRLGRGYLLEVQRTSGGLVRCRQRDGGGELRLLGLRPVLLKFGAAHVSAVDGAVRCTYPIVGGALTRRPAGTLTIAQGTGERPELQVAVEGFFPRLGILYGLERWLHMYVSRRYLRRLPAEAER
jgi:hypothetical protein